MANRPDSVFKSTKVFIEQTVGITTDTAKLVRSELKHTSRLNALENDAEFDDTLVSQVLEISEKLEKLEDTQTNKLVRRVYEKQLARLEALV